MLQKVTIHESTPNRHQSYLFRAGYDKGVRTHHPDQHQHPALKGRQGSGKALSHKKGQDQVCSRWMLLPWELEAGYLETGPRM